MDRLKIKQVSDMTSRKKAAGLEALAHIEQPIGHSETPDEPPAQSTVKKTKSFPLHLPLEAHEALREIAFHERTSMTQVILQGVDTIFKARGLKSIAEMKHTS